MYMTLWVTLNLRVKSLRELLIGSSCIAGSHRTKLFKSISLADKCETIVSSCVCMHVHTCTGVLVLCVSARVPYYSGYFSWGKIFVSSEFWANSWKIFHGRCIDY